MQKAILATLVVFFPLSCQQQKKGSDIERQNVTELKDSLTSKLTALLENGNIKGYGVAIVNEDTTLYARGFGFSKTREKIPYTKNTLQNIASVSKTLIGIALLKAQELGKLKLDDPIAKYLPFTVSNPNYPKEAITIRHLATHTSSIQDGETYGLKSYILQHVDTVKDTKSVPYSEEFNHPDKMTDLGTFLENFLSVQGTWYSKTHYLEKKPGERYEYSNVGATLAAYIIERATGKNYRDFTKDHILRPLNMSATGWRTTDINTTKRTQLYTVEGVEIPDYTLITYPDGGLITSVEDKAKYLIELIRAYSGKGKLLSQNSYKQFFSPMLDKANFEGEERSSRPFDDEYNSGLFLGHTPIEYLGHTGGDPGVSTFMFFNPKTKIGKLLFVNTDLDQKGADQFYAIWNVMSTYETKLNQAQVK